MAEDAPLIEDSGCFVVMTTVASIVAARELSRPLVEQRLAACANLVDRVESIYWWNDALHQEGEVLILFKVAEGRLQEFKSELLRRHPYEVPEIVVLHMDAVSQPYLRWLLETTAEPN